MPTELDIPDFGDPEPMDNSGALEMLSKALSPEAPTAPRGADGKFAKAEKPEADASEAKVIDLKTGKPPEVAADEAEEEDDDPEFEIPSGEEGKEPQRLKFSKIYEGYERAAKLEAEVNELKTVTQRVPEEYQTAMQDVMARRKDYIDRMEILERTINPVRPHAAYIDPASEHYNPDAYADGMRRFEQQSQLLRGVQADLNKQKKAQSDEEMTLRRVRLSGEIAKMKEVWPEFYRDSAVKGNVAKTLEEYGFTKEEIDGMDDHRHMRIVKDALELRALKAKQAEAVKVVRSKPKLVKGSARSTTDSKASTRHTAMSRLQASGSMDDGVRALKALL